ncbi:MAG TPA: Calx-beta domain-containing protein, partial [Pyrinomonadaceae bacterium]
PGEPNTVAVARYYRGVSPPEAGVAIFDNGAQRTKTGAGHIAGSDYVAYSASPSKLYGGGTSDGLRTMTIDATGVASTKYASITAGTRIKFAGGLIYGSSGRVMNPDTGVLLGTFNGASSYAFVPDAAAGRVFYLTREFFSGALTLRAYDVNTFLPLGSQTIPGVGGDPTTLIRWGVNGLAFRTTSNELYVIQSALVSPGAPIPTGFALAADKLNAFEYNSSLTVNVTRTGDLSGAASVSYATSDGTATAGVDYTAASGTLNFAAGESSKSFNIPIKSDNIFEGNETFNVALSNPTGGVELFDPAGAVVTLNDDDSRPFVSIADVRVSEGNSGTTEAQFLVTLSNPSIETVSVNYATANGTASSPGDFNAASGTLTFPALTTSASVKVTVNGDLQVEPDETFTVGLSGPVNSFLSRSQATGTIANDDGPGRLQFSAQSYSLSEDGGSALITVNRVSGLSGAVLINYATSDGTAAAGSDYAPTSGTLNFAEGEASKTFSVPVINDALNEPNETVNLTLSGPTGGASLGSPAAATLTITNDDRPLVQFGSTFYTAGEKDGQVLLTVRRTGDPSAPLSVDYTTADGT